jgi:hypothetical protein
VLVPAEIHLIAISKSIVEEKHKITLLLKRWKTKRGRVNGYKKAVVQFVTPIFIKF